MNKDVALVLSSGGPRGFAYIGAIEELTPPPPRAKSGISRMAKKCLPHICTTTAKRRSHRLKKPDTALLQY